MRHYQQDRRGKLGSTREPVGDANVAFRCSEEMVEEMRAAAQAADTDLSTWIRSALRRVLRLRRKEEH